VALQIVFGMVALERLTATLNKAYGGLQGSFVGYVIPIDEVKC
jgi:hypothetical protein